MYIPAPPKNSQIAIDSTAHGSILSWKKPTGGVFRYLVAAFLMFWLCGWAFGLVMAVLGLFSAEEAPKAFLAVWLAMWTLGGVFAIGMLYLLLRPQKPESLTLEHNRIVYDTGTTPPWPCMNPFWMMRKHQYANPSHMLFQRRKVYEFSRSQCPEFVLEGQGDEQRLRFDDGADRITIGEFLKEPEREWLAEVLEDWRRGY